MKWLGAREATVLGRHKTGPQRSQKQNTKAPWQTKIASVTRHRLQWMLLSLRPGRQTTSMHCTDNHPALWVPREEGVKTRRKKVLFDRQRPNAWHHTMRPFWFYFRPLRAHKHRILLQKCPALASPVSAVKCLGPRHLSYFFLKFQQEKDE